MMDSNFVLSDNIKEFVDDTDLDFDCTGFFNHTEEDGDGFPEYNSNLIINDDNKSKQCTTNIFWDAL